MLEFLLTLAISLIPVGSGLAVMVYQQDRKLTENARISLQEAIYSVDLSLDRLHAITTNALMLTSKPCAEIKVSLIEQVAQTQYLRSLALSHKHQVYCTSLPGYVENRALYGDTHTPLQLVFDSPSTLDSAILTYQLEQDGFSAVATAYAEQLRNELRAFQDGLTLLIEIGDTYIWADGDARSLSRPSQSEYFHQAVSQKYGYVIKAGYANGYSANEARQSMIMVLPSLVLIGIITGAVIYWALFRRGARGGTAANLR
ncbi:CSS-motif domain-containing protein [Pseudomonas sp. KU43P]|uniref:CSS-motif domain-containing protein n=1 Tax=Pseudomonas sp. KU43P TaxID=2487887 RepID=UPI0012AA7A7E|nr:CSS-motif domain-containing protein [Pseudomonas sp. KU43P]BBH46329.1 hypothetical protein KU43P_28060 [Pseudomonas sp. KU43P]